MIFLYKKMISLQTKNFKWSLTEVRTKQVVSASGAIFWPSQQSAKAMHGPRQQQQVPTTKAVHITWAPMWYGNNTNSWNNPFWWEQMKLAFVVEQKNITT